MNIQGNNYTGKINQKLTEPQKFRKYTSSPDGILLLLCGAGAEAVGGCARPDEGVSEFCFIGQGLVGDNQMTRLLIPFRSKAVWIQLTMLRRKATQRNSDIRGAFKVTSQPSTDL